MAISFPSAIADAIPGLSRRGDLFLARDFSEAEINCRLPPGDGSHRHSRSHLARGFSSHPIRNNVESAVSLHRLETWVRFRARMLSSFSSRTRPTSVKCPAEALPAGSLLQGLAKLARAWNRSDGSSAAARAITSRNSGILFASGYRPVLR